MSFNYEVSIILPVYNAEKTVYKTIVSVLSQENLSFELIIIDDGSTDTTPTILEQFKNNPIVKIISQPNNGVSSARNQGIKQATGKYCFFIDSDDFLEKSTISEMLKMANQKKLDLVCCNHREINTTIMDSESESKESMLLTTSTEIAKALDSLYLQSACAKLFKLVTLKKEKIYFKKEMSLGEDLNFSLNYLLYVKRVGYIGTVSYIINNINPYSLSKKYAFNLENDITIQHNSWQKLITINPEIEKEYEKKHINFEYYLLKVYFGNLFRFNSPLSIKDKRAKIKHILINKSEWIDLYKGRGNPQSVIDRIVMNVICTNNLFLIYFFFCIKEKLRRLMFFVGKKKYKS